MLIVKILNTKEKNSVTPELTTIAYFYALIHLNASDWFVIKLQFKELKDQLLNFVSTSTGTGNGWTKRPAFGLGHVAGIT